VKPTDFSNLLSLSSAWVGSENTIRLRRRLVHIGRVIGGITRSKSFTIHSQLYFTLRLLARNKKKINGKRRKAYRKANLKP
jgi:hypothetical protein